MHTICRSDVLTDFHNLSNGCHGNIKRKLKITDMLKEIYAGCKFRH